MTLRSSCLVMLFSLPLFAACTYGDHDHGYRYDDVGSGYNPPASTTVEQATIDTDQALDIEAGAGAGVFVEYAAGGTYYFTTACDSGPHSSACYWDILVTPLDGASVSGVSADNLESDDSVTLGSGDAVRFVAYTSKDFDGFTLQTQPGAAIEVDALLENSPANRYMFWVGDGALHSGAPSNPVDLVPSAE